MTARREHRFYVEDRLHQGLRLSLSRIQAKQITAVLRLRQNDRLFLFDGCGSEFEARIIQTQNQQVEVEVERRLTDRPAPRFEIELAMALVKSDRFELVIQKATELGVARIIPISTSRTVVSLKTDHDQHVHKLERWQRIAIEASEQSGRLVLPSLSAPMPFDEIVTESHVVPTIVMWEGERRTPLAKALSRNTERIRLIVGPEGGFTSEEIELATAHGAQLASLGPFVLRAETAALAAIAGVHALMAAVDLDLAWGFTVRAPSE